MRDPQALMSTADLASLLGQPSLRVYDCTTYLETPPPGSDDPYVAVPGRRTFQEAHSPGAWCHKGADPQSRKARGGGGDGRPGRVRGSVSPPAATLVNPDAKDFTSLSDAEAKFRARGVSGDKRVICYCGGGISATIDLFLLHQLGHDTLTLYDGSMGEWARDPSLPIETD